MKVSRKTKIRIRKAVSFIRTALFWIALICIGLTICSVDGPSLLFPIIYFVIGMVCAAISYVLDYLLWETSYKGDM